MLKSISITVCSNILYIITTVHWATARSLDYYTLFRHFAGASIPWIIMSMLIIIIGDLPDAYMTTSIIPILKNKNGDTSAKNCYRPIAIVTVMSKIFELCLATVMDAHLVTSDNQFGFKQKHSTDLCINTVKSIIQYYNYYNNPVYTCLFS